MDAALDGIICRVLGCAPRSNLTFKLQGYSTDETQEIALGIERVYGRRLSSREVLNMTPGDLNAFVTR
jgi:hypothetical protein